MLRHLALTGLLIAFCGCGAQVSSDKPGDEVIPQGLAQFGPGTPDGQPGIDFGSIRYADKRVIVWSDGMDGAVEIRRGTINGVLRARAPGSGECEYEYPLSGRGTAIIAGQKFDMADGNMFLVSLRGPQVRVRQLRRDLTTVEITHNGDNASALKRFMKQDRDFQEFFGRGTPAADHGS